MNTQFKSTWANRHKLEPTLSGDQLASIESKVTPAEWKLVEQAHQSETMLFAVTGVIGSVVAYTVAFSFLGSELGLLGDEPKALGWFASDWPQELRVIGYSKLGLVVLMSWLLPVNMILKRMPPISSLPWWMQRCMGAMLWSVFPLVALIVFELGTDLSKVAVLLACFAAASVVEVIFPFFRWLREPSEEVTR